MANARLTNIYKFLKVINFTGENTFSSDVLCTICNKILVNAHSGPCGCRYCLECISAHLDGEGKCPGNTDDCKSELLNINTNIHVDHPMNIKISKLIVKCPERECDEYVELRKLEDHFRVCKWRPTNCPFFNVDTTERYLLAEDDTHTKLLMDCIDVLRDEMREEMKSKELVIDELRAVIAQQSREIDRLSGKLESFEAANLDSRNYGQKLMNESVTQFGLKGGDVDFEIGGLEERLVALVTQQNQLNYYGEFVWPIDNFSDKRQNAQNGIETQIFSDAFFSHKNGYRMCLSVYPDGVLSGKGSHLSVYIHLMRGPFDDILQWPIKCDLTIAIVNQQTRLSHISKTIKSANSPNSNKWKKPIVERNDKGYGNAYFIKFAELLGDVALCANDRIFIKCTVQTF